MTTTRNIYYVHDDGSAELHCGDAVILLDGVDVDRVSNFQWSIGIHGYATSGAGKEQMLMHRLIINAAERDFVDHINRNKLDNRKENLRICTQSQNLYNQPAKSISKSGYKGVCQIKNGKWQAQIVYNNKPVYLGVYDDPMNAALVYDYAARHLFGEFAYLNFPEVTNSEIEIKDIRRRYVLDKEQVESIRALYKDGMSISELATMYSHSYTSINRIVRNKTFAVNEEEDVDE